MPEAKEPVILSPEKIPQHADDTDVLVDKIIGMVKGYSPNANTDMIYVAYKLAKSAHSHQFRRSGAPYIEHPVQLAYIAAQLSLDATAISAALLHDVVEDTPYTYENIETIFGKSVAELVDGVTKLRKIKYNTREEQQVENLRKMFLAMAKDIRVVIIKLIDRLHNMRTLNFMPRAKQLLISKETLDVYAPLAHRLGMSKIKIELEDLALKYLDPVAYEEIRQSINQKKDEREKYIRDIMDVLREKLDQMNIKSQVTGRAKHFYSIFRKMYTQNKTIDELYDLFAVRIIVDTVADCYAVLGMVHDLYTPVPMRFKDYIAMPKQNMYQSLHTTLIGPSGQPFEIQIRTYEMHRTAEYGIAAHWKYKEANNGNATTTTVTEEEKLSWLRQILEWQQDMSDNKEFMTLLKSDLNLFSDNVFAFTPSGDVKNLPKGSTPIDFAYSIHSAVGNKMVGAKVNGKLVPIDYVIKNGDQIEIITSQNSKGPSRDWLKVVKSTQAKNKINQWFRSELKEENIQHGKDLIAAYAKAKGINFAEINKPEYQEKIRRKYGFHDWNSCLATVGHGGLKESQIVNRMYDEYKKDHVVPVTDADVLGSIAEKQQAAAGTQPEHKSKSGIVVHGLYDVAVHFSKCCNPVPGDEIVGFVTRGRGISIHRTDCVNIINLSKIEKDRLIEAEWQDTALMDNGAEYQADLKIFCHDRPGLLVDITKIFTEKEINISGIQSKTSKQGIATIEVFFNIKGRDQIKVLVEKLRQIESVIDVERTTG